MRAILKTLIFAIVLQLLLVGHPRFGFSENFTLQSVHENILQSYPEVRHLTAGALEKALKDPDRYVIFDVREEDEFAVSHIAGSIRVKPSIWTSSFIKKFAEKTKGKHVIFYCSVGVRSSRLAEKTQTRLRELGAKSVHNLKGGIFSWHNQEKGLRNTAGQTEFVHPYDQKWGSLVTRKSLHKYLPEKQ